jgi:hypothetical protein
MNFIYNYLKITFFYFSILILMFFSNSATAAYNDAGTDYSNAGVEEWTEDSANELISLANSFACIIKNSRGDRAEHVNGSWQALIDEAACGLASDNSQGGKSIAKTMLTSSRASDSSPQEVTAWFLSSNSDRYIANVTVTSDAETLPPFGAWYFSFYRERAGASGASVDLTLGNLGTTDNGFTNIYQSGDDIKLDISEIYTETGMSQTQAATFTILNGDTDTVKFLGKSTVVTGGGTTITGTVGQTDANYYYKATVNSAGAVDTSTDQCLSRGTKWANNFDYKLYNASTGAAVSLNAGYGFETAAGTRGYLGSWGTWFDNDANPFSPSAASVSATKNSDASSITFYWSPGKLSSLTEVTEALSDGDSFRWQSYYATWDAANSRFDLVDENGTSQGTLSGSDVVTNPWKGYMWSDLKRTEVRWTGTGSTNISFYVKSYKDATSSLSSATSTTFYCVESECPGSTSGGANYTKMSYTDFVAQGTDGFMQGSTNDLYFYTGKTPGGSYEPFTMYHDTDDSADLSTSDTPIRFDFKVSNQGEYTLYPDGSTGSFSTNNWPSKGFNFILKSQVDDSTCSLGSPGACTNYEWKTGAYPWHHSVMIYDSSDTGVKLDEPIQFNYTFADTSDVNNALGDSGSGLTFTTTSDYNPVKSLCTLSSGTYTCSDITPDDLDGRKFLLEYDGENLQGLPGVDAQGANNTMWLKLVNLADGTTLTDTAGNSYVTKATAVGYSFTSTNMSNCSDIDFTNVSEIGLSMDDVPDITDNDTYPRPIDVDWSDIVTADSTSCDVVQGVVTCP